MEKLLIESTKSSPEVVLDPENNIISFKGQSYPENAFKFYEPIFNWVEKYIENIEEEVQVEIELNLPYINTSSTKCFMMLLELFDEAYLEGKKVGITWYYNEENESELECAEEFKEDLSLPFNIIAK
ncbi:DUF1987 domain-containing protein [Bacillus sp. Marseille-P3661]|uniref:DUF1987 domain-containing protein n=1 Tax=Bacillus sp. Marseille-P3661 TaxID=1936234 RepID=UPI000C84E13E|nr:DUF1987 domain-containing protein [Bacillus sp. Marseille-P3661]